MNYQIGINFAERQVPCDVFEDCKRIQEVLSFHYIISLVEAFKLWKQHSESCDASWLILPKIDDNLRSELMSFIND